MNRKIVLACMAAISIIVPRMVFAETKGEMIMRRIEELQDITTDVRAKVDLTQTKVDQGTKKLEMLYYRRDADDSFLIVMVNPENERGNGYLRVGDNFWMYRRNTRTFQHINRDESIGGSDAHADDFEKRKFRELYEMVKDPSGNEAIKEETLGEIPVYRIELKAKVNDVDYPKKVMWVSRDKTLPLKEQSYSLSGTLMETAYYLNYTMVSGKYVPIKQLFIDEFEKGNKTIVELSGLSTQPLDNKIFTKPYLENLSK